MFQLELSNQAIRDLDVIFDNLSIYLQDKVHSAKLVDAIIAELEQLASAPYQMGISRNELLFGLRSRPFKGYILYYSYRQNKMLIQRIIHGSRDVRPKHFKGEAHD